MKKPIDLYATLGLALVIGTLASSAWLADGSTGQLADNERWVKHTYDVVVRLDSLLATVVDAETGQRGYLLTDEPRYLQPYRQATPCVGEMLSGLSLDTADNPVQQERLRSLTVAIGEHLRLLAATLTEGNDQHRYRRLELLDRGKHSMDEIREQVAAMRMEEMSLLSERLRRSSTSFRTTRIVFFGTTIVAMALVLLTHAMLRRDMIGRRRANALLESVNAELREGLRAAAKVQASLLPPVGLRRDGMTFAWAFQPCEELAGDALSICPLADGRTAIYLLDVSGHGAAAALSAVSVVQSLTPTNDASRLALGIEAPVVPDEVMRALDSHFAWDDSIGQFFTICYGVVDPLRREFHYCSAGHPPPVLVRRGEPAVLLRSTTGLPIGLGGDFDVATISLKPGDRLYLYSDGVTETAHEHEETLFGGRRLLETFDRYHDHELQTTIDGILSELAEWRGAARARDDVSLLAVQIG